MQLFYAPEIKIDQETYFFDKQESKHIVRVLRKQEQDILDITNGRGTFFKAQITFANERKCEVKIIDAVTQPKREFYIHLAVAPTKMNDRYEWFLEKATEIGIDEVTPIFCDHSERKIIKAERYEKIILSAMKQSNQPYLPKLNAAETFSSFINKSHSESKYIAHCAKNKKTPLKNNFKPNDRYLLLIGPEGDFSSKEIELALNKGYQAVTLGNTRLRTETAAVIACHSLVFANEKINE